MDSKQKFQGNICYASDLSSLLSFMNPFNRHSTHTWWILLSPKYLFQLIFFFLQFIIFSLRIKLWSRLTKVVLFALIYDLKHFHSRENKISPLLKNGAKVFSSYLTLPYLPVNSIATLCSREFKITSHQQIKERASLQNGNTMSEIH